MFHSFTHPTNPPSQHRYFKHITTSRFSVSRPSMRSGIPRIMTPIDRPSPNPYCTWMMDRFDTPSQYTYRTPSQYTYRTLSIASVTPSQHHRNTFSIPSNVPFLYPLTHTHTPLNIPSNTPSHSLIHSLSLTLTHPLTHSHTPLLHLTLNNALHVVYIDCTWTRNMDKWIDVMTGVG